MVKAKKNPWLSAILNLILPGLGYVYNGKRIVFGIALSAILLLVVITTFNYPPLSIQIQYLLGREILFSIAFAYDGYQEAKELNKRKSN